MSWKFFFFKKCYRDWISKREFHFRWTSWHMWYSRFVIAVLARRFGTLLDVNVCEKRNKNQIAWKNAELRIFGQFEVGDCNGNFNEKFFKVFVQKLLMNIFASRILLLFTTKSKRFLSGAPEFANQRLAQKYRIIWHIKPVLAIKSPEL